MSAEQPSDAIRRALQSGPRYALCRTVAYNAAATVTGINTAESVDQATLLNELSVAVRGIALALETTDAAISENADITIMVLRSLDKFNGSSPALKRH